MITIIDYGLGNIKAFANVYKTLEVPIKIARHADDLKRANKVIMPGVGAFDYAIQRLEKSGMRQILEEIVLYRKVPVLGVCVGMQMLARSSEEGKQPGLGWIDAEVKKFDTASFSCAACLPHMGWNDVKAVKTNGLFHDIGHVGQYYFLHSYIMHCRKKENVIAVADYGGEFVCAVNSDNIYGVQFHPEKSHHWGIQLLNNFAKI
jgi:glutamine amidotransferase